MLKFRLLVVIMAMGLSTSAMVHPLRLSMCEIEYTSNKELLTVNLKLFLTDVNEAITFDPYSKELNFCLPNESANANKLLMNYVNKFFYIKVNSKLVELKIKHKKLKGEGDNTALWVYFESTHKQPLNTMEIKNAVFTDLFFDQNNIVYVHVDNKSKSLMLDKKKSTHQLKF